jgi:23S rRNA G2445 N2-methylase RlmL
MKGLVICNKGIEDVAVQEVEEIIDEVGVVNDNVVIFDADVEKLAKLTYLARSIRRTMMLLGRATISKKYDDLIPLITQLVKQIDSEEWMEGKTFKVLCERIGDHDFSSQDVAEKVGELLLKKHKCNVAMEDPIIKIYVFINQYQMYLGVDFAGFDLSKREYKLFSIGSSLNGALAYALLRIAKLKHNEVLLDPFCGPGIIPIEAGLYLKNISTNYYRKDKLWFTRFLKINPSKFDKKFEPEAKVIAYDKLMNFMQATRKNSQIAGISKYLDVSKVDIEWLDTKLNQGQIDKIVTKMPSLTKNTNDKDIEKIYREFFHQADFILDEKGKIIFVIQNDQFFKECLAKISEMKKFEISKERDVMQGSMDLKVITMKRM